VQLPRTAKIGLAIVVVGIVAPIALSIWHATIHFVPVYKTITLTPGHLQQQFTLNFSGFYVMEIEVERKLPHETLQCLLGLQDEVHDGHCKDIPQVLQFSWKLDRDGQTFQSGSSAKIIGGSYSDATVASEFASFEGKRGHHTCWIWISCMTAHNSPSQTQNSASAWMESPTRTSWCST
jgi:hypothetical protein